MSRYEFSLLQEVLMEKGAGVLGDLYRYEWANGISATEDLTHPVVVVHDLVWSAKRDILSAQTEEELAKIEAEFDFRRSILERDRGGCECLKVTFRHFASGMQ